jgi:hypothetical protein
MSSPAMRMRAWCRSITSSCTPTLNLPQLAVCRQALRAQRAGPADRLAAGIADDQFAAGLTLLPAHRPQLRVGRTAVEVGRGVIAEICDAKPTLLFQPLISIAWRHIGGDRIVFAGLQRASPL